MMGGFDDAAFFALNAHRVLMFSISFLFWISLWLSFLCFGCDYILEDWSIFRGVQMLGDEC
jgi:hypothetical protein